MAVYDTLNKPQKGGCISYGRSAFDPGGSGFGKNKSFDSQNCIPD